jgi:NAD(P)-dependent dehydrogenase (short-subunit alcohol dehydrogenase family)
MYSCFAASQFVAQLLQQGNTVLATGRDPSSSPGLQKLAEQYGDKLITTSLEASDPGSIVQWAAAVKESSRIPHVDVSCSCSLAVCRRVTS